MVDLTFDHFQPEIKMKVIFNYSTFSIVFSSRHNFFQYAYLFPLKCGSIPKTFLVSWRKIWPIPCSECKRAKTRRPWIASLPQTLQPASLLGLNNCIGTAIVRSQVNSFLWLTVWKRDILLDFCITKPSNWLILHVGFVFLFLLLFWLILYFLSLEILN